MTLPYQALRTSEDALAYTRLPINKIPLRYIVLAMGYSQGVLNLYAGPLFANLIAYDLLDCAVWGISPTIFFFLQPKLRQFVTTGDNCYRKRFALLVLCTVLFLPVSYAALNYSQKFKWNYLTKLVNLDVGYIVLDLSMKMVGFIFSIEADEESNITQETRALEVVNSHKLTFAAELGCYIIAFCVCVLGRKGHQYYHYSLFTSSLVGCILILPIPVIYYFQHLQVLKLSYKECPEVQVIGEEDIQHEFRKSAKLELLAYFFLRASLLINLAYSTLWIMTNYLNSKLPENRAFMQSVKWGSFYFIISAVLSFSFGYLLTHFTAQLKTITCVFHIVFGTILIYCWTSFTLEGFGTCIVFSGLQLALLNHYEAVTQLRHLMDRVVLVAEIASFCLIPIVITLTTEIDEAVIFVVLSGVACLLASGLLIFV